MTKDAELFLSLNSFGDVCNFILLYKSFFDNETKNYNIFPLKDKEGNYIVDFANNKGKRLFIENNTTVDLSADITFDNNSNYEVFPKRKKSGGMRIIFAPRGDLKIVQKRLNKILQEIYFSIRPSSAFGFCKIGVGTNNGIVENAQMHVGKKYLLSIDLFDFFPTIKRSDVVKVFSGSIFNKSEAAAKLLADIVTYKNTLPQGAPTSPIISNFVLVDFDEEFMRLSQEKGWNYSRYADDITLSSNEYFTGKSFEDVKRIVEKYGFKVNYRKVRFRSNSRKQMVTGIVVNNKVNVERHYVQKLRAILNNCLKRNLILEYLLFNMVEKGIWKDNSRGYLKRVRASVYSQESSIISFWNQCLTLKQKELNDSFIDPKSKYDYFENNYKSLIKELEEKYKLPYGRIQEIARIAEANVDFEGNTRYISLEKFMEIHRGKIEFISVVRGKDDILFNNLKDKFNRIQDKKSIGEKVKYSLVPIKDVIEQSLKYRIVAIRKGKQKGNAFLCSHMEHVPKETTTISDKWIKIITPKLSINDVEIIRNIVTLFYQKSEIFYLVDRQNKMNLNPQNGLNLLLIELDELIANEAKKKQVLFRSYEFSSYLNLILGLRQGTIVFKEDKIYWNHFLLSLDDFILKIANSRYKIHDNGFAYHWRIPFSDFPFVTITQVGNKLIFSPYNYETYVDYVVENYCTDADSKVAEPELLKN